MAAWQRTVDEAYHLGHGPLPAQSEVIGAVNDACGERDVVVQAAGSMPGDLQLLWRARDPKQYHVEYGYSCMGFEIAGALGIKLADPSREVYALVGDGSYLMMSQEIVTAVSEGIKLIVVLVQNHGFASIGALSESLGSQRFGTSYRYRDDDRRLRRRHAADRPGRQRGEPGRERDPLPHHRRSDPGPQAGPRRGPAHRRAHRDRPAVPGAVLGELVGRAGLRGLHSGQHPWRPGPPTTPPSAASANTCREGLN